MEEGMDRFKLLHEWLDCNDEAGSRLWSDTGLFQEFRDRAMSHGWKYVAELRRKGRYVYVTAEEMESYATRQILTIHDRLKPPDPQKQGMKPEDFSTLEQFYGYLSSSLVGIRDEIDREIGRSPVTVSLDEPLPGEGEVRTLNDILAVVVPSPEEITIRNQRREMAAKLLRQFRESLERRPSLQSHFDTLCEAHRAGRNEIPVEEVAEEIIIFLESPHVHFPEIHEYCKNAGINEETYHSNNRRLRLEWRKFRDGTGLKQWKEYIALLLHESGGRT